MPNENVQAWEGRGKQQEERLVDNTQNAVNIMEAYATMVTETCTCLMER